jgi:16S rRNA (uracil1498-N3)-methyltransferase
MHRFFIPGFQPALDEEVSLVAIHNQLRRVLRMQPGDQIVILDNAGGERLLEITAVERRDTLARVLELRSAPVEPEIPVTLYQCVLKSDKFELVLQKATELGVTTVVPVVSNRTVARVGRVLASKQARWESIVREAAEQSGRGGLPVVAPSCTFAEAIANATGVRLLPWEEGVANPGLLAALSQAPQPVDAVSVMIGPEGGFEADEVTAAIDAGWQVVSLGERILRAETAAMAAMSIVSAALGELGDAPLVRLWESSVKSMVIEGTAKIVKSEISGQAAEDEGETKKKRRSKKQKAEDDDESQIIDLPPTSVTSKSG